jgi:hypothetical protein
VETERQCAFLREQELTPIWATCTVPLFRKTNLTG